VIAIVQLRAGRYAASASNFPSAATFFENGIAALGDRAWKDETYDVSLNLHNSCAEVYYCVGSFERMDVLLDAVFENTRSFHDKLQAYTTLVYSYSSRNRMAEALNVTFDVLKDLGEPMPTAPGILTILHQYFKTAGMLRGKTDEFFSEPANSDRFNQNCSNC
jgi:predicted ATPase